MTHKILAVCLDCGDTLIDEATEVKTAEGVSLRAELIPGADELVRALKARGYRLALVADGPVATFPNNLAPYGLYDLFDAYAISETVGYEKPDARMFEAACAQLGIAPEDYGSVVMMGNYLARDVKGANDVGMISVWLDWAPRRPKAPADASEQPHYTVTTPLGLLDVLEELEG